MHDTDIASYYSEICKIEQKFDSLGRDFSRYKPFRTTRIDPNDHC